MDHVHAGRSGTTHARRETANGRRRTSSYRRFARCGARGAGWPGLSGERAGPGSMPPGAGGNSRLKPDRAGIGRGNRGRSPRRQIEPHPLPGRVTNTRIRTLCQQNSGKAKGQFHAVNTCPAGGWARPAHRARRGVQRRKRAPRLGCGSQAGTGGSGSDPCGHPRAGAGGREAHGPP